MSAAGMRASGAQARAAPREPGPTDYLSYWVPATAKYELARMPTLLNHAASGQYDRVARGDVLWIVTVWPGGRLALLGPLTVGEIADPRRAREALHTTDLWDAPYHALAAPGTAVPARDVDLSDLAAQLRFESRGGRDRLVVDGGRVHANQLQTMRRLTPDSAARLRARWTKVAAPAAGDPPGFDAHPTLPPSHHTGGGFGDADANREVERAAVDAVTAALEGDGWQVTSVEAEHRGYDLHCTRGGSDAREELHVEVKGTRGGEPAFMLTARELTQARTDAAFVLYVVVDALGPGNRLLHYAGAKLETTFALSALTYRAVLRTSSSDAVQGGSAES